MLRKGISVVLFPDVCKDCKPPKRSAYCHADCPDYTGAKDEHAIKVEKERKAKKAENDADAVTYMMTKG